MLPVSVFEPASLVSRRAPAWPAAATTIERAKASMVTAPEVARKSFLDTSGLYRPFLDGRVTSLFTSSWHFYSSSLDSTRSRNVIRNERASAMDFLLHPVNYPL